MIERRLKIGNWKVRFLFAKDFGDVEKIARVLEFAGAADDTVAYTVDFLDREDWNCGFTFSNQEKKQAVVYIGPSDSGEEFINTVSHELYHLAVAIADSLGIDLSGETPAYIVGDSIQSIVDIVCRLGCPCCNGDKEFT